MSTIIGIDGGKSGGWVMNNNGIITTGKLDPLCDFLEFMDSLNTSTTTVYLEKLTGFVAGKPMPAARAFKMGEFYFVPMGMIMGLGIRLELVTPQKWQKVLGCGTRSGRSTPQWKNHLKDMAKRLYPREKVVGWNADAYLILEYGLKQEKEL